MGEISWENLAACIGFIWQGIIVEMNWRKTSLVCKQNKKELECPQITEFIAVIINYCFMHSHNKIHNLEMYLNRAD